MSFLTKNSRLGAVLASFLLVPFFSLAAPPAPPTKVKLALNWKAEPQFGGFYAAALNGEFKKRNLEVEILEGGSGTPTVQMISSEKADFGIVSAEEILIARDHGADVVGLFASFQTNPQAIMTHEAAGFHSLKELFAAEGILAWQSGLSYAQFLSKKYPAAKVQKVPYTGGITGFLKNPRYSQQCFFTSEPLLAEKAGEKVKTFLVSEEGFNPYTTVLASNGQTLKKNPALVGAMVEAVRAGWKAYLADPGATNKHMATLNKAMDSETFLKSAQRQKDLIQTAETEKRGLGFMNEGRWKDLIAQLKEMKLLKKPLTAGEAFRNF
jgi:NitT/TauT family transport system substrate-binding protein